MESCDDYADFDFDNGDPGDQPGTSAEADVLDGNLELCGAEGEVKRIERKADGIEFDVAVMASASAPKEIKQVTFRPPARSFCWPMAGDRISLVYSAPEPKSSEDGQDPTVTLALPPAIFPSIGKRQMIAYLRATQILRAEAKKLYEILAAKAASMPRAKRDCNFYEMMCRYSLPETKTQAVEKSNSPEFDFPWFACAVRRWYRQQTLRRLYNLQVTSKELRASLMNANELYELCCRDPYLVATLPLAKARLICGMLGKEVTPQMQAEGEVVRLLQEQLASYGNLAVAEERLAKSCPAYGAAGARLLEEKAIVALDFERPLVCLAPAFRLCETAAACLRPAALAPLKVARWNDPSLSKDQREAVEGALSNRVSAITGRSGKRRVIAELAFQAHQQRRSVRVLTFSGRAAMRLEHVFSEVKTSHLLTGRPSGDCPAADARSTSTSPQSGAPRAEGHQEEFALINIHQMTFRAAERADLLIIDKAAMLPITLLCHLRSCCPWLEDEKTSLVFVFDPHLPSLGAGHISRQLLKSRVPRFALGACPNGGSSKSSNPNCSGQKKAAPSVARFADWVLGGGQGKPPVCEGVEVGNRDIKKLLFSLVRSERPPLFPKVICPFRKKAGELNAFLRSLLLVPALRAEEGARRFAPGRSGAARSAQPQLPAFVPGDRVIMTRNDHFNDIYSGEEGLVESVRDAEDQRESELSVSFESAGSAKVVEFFDIPPRPFVESEDDAGFEKFKKASVGELELAYALTVRRALGKKWDDVVLYIPPRRGSEQHLANDFLYGAVTTARRRLWVVCDLGQLREIAATKPAPAVDPTHLLI